MGFRQQRMWCTFIGVPENTWNHFERGRRPITPEVAVKVFGRTGATMDWIYMGIESGLPAHLVRKLQNVPEDPPIIPGRRAANG